MAKKIHYELVPDKRGLVWDLLLYIPTVTALALISVNLWYSPNQTWAYLLVFLASFFFVAGLNRVLGRMLLLPTAPVALSVEKNGVQLTLRNGSQVDLVKDVRFFSDYAGKSFGLTGMDLSGKKRQFVFHRGQFPDESAYKATSDSLRVFS